MPAGAVLTTTGRAERSIGQQPAPPRFEHCLGAARDAKLAKDGCQVHAHGRLRDAEPACDRLVRFAGAEPLQHLDLARR